jgi:hypothetical protein
MMLHADCCTLRVTASHKVFASLRGCCSFVDADLASCSDVNMFKTEYACGFEEWDWVESRATTRTESAVDG